MRWPQTEGVSCCGPGCWTCSLVAGTQWVTVRLKITEEQHPVTIHIQASGFILGSSPFRKLRWDSRICTTSLTQALQVSVDEACNWKCTTLPSGLRDVSTKRASSPSTPGSTPRQLTWKTAHLTSRCEAFGPPSSS